LKARKSISNILFYVFGISIAVIILYPIFWTILLSIKPAKIVFDLPPVYLFQPDFSAWTGLGKLLALGGSEFSAYLQLLNSFIISIGNTLLALVLAIPTAYAFARYDFKGKNSLFFWFISYRMMPVTSLMVPIYLMAVSLGLLDTHLVLILFYLTFNLPYAVWMLYGFFKAIPRDIDEAAMLDGCSTIQILQKVILPIVTPGLVACAFFCFIFAWNELPLAIILGGPNSQKLLVSAAESVSFMPYHHAWPIIGSMTLMYAAPCLLGSFLLRKYLVRGMALGTVKR
jgi:multiple sugar transport system permease protein